MKDNKKETIKKLLESFWRDKKNGDVVYIGDDKVRFILGEVGTNTIICFGINPSTANDIKDDPTISKIRKIASENNCDGWIMLNLYPQRATNPNYKIYILAQMEKFYAVKIEKIMVHRCVQLFINNVYKNLNLENNSI